MTVITISPTEMLSAVLTRGSRGFLVGEELSSASIRSRFLAIAFDGHVGRGLGELRDTAQSGHAHQPGRLISRISSTFVRRILPSAVITMISSLSRTWWNDTAGPFFSVTLTLMMPRPARPWMRYSVTSVRLP